MDAEKEKKLDEILECVCRYSISNKQIKESVNELTRFRSLGYIDIVRRHSANGDTMKITPTPVGQEFFRNGGFKACRKKKIKEKVYKWVDFLHKMVSIAALILSIIAICSK